MSKGFEPPLRIALRVDKRLALINHVAHLATGVMLGFVQAPIWLVLAIILGLVASHRYCSVVYVHRTHPKAIVLLILETDGSWTLHRRGAWTSRNVRLKTYFVCPGWIIARYGLKSGRTSSVIFTRKTTDSDIFRRLKMHLRG